MLLPTLARVFRTTLVLGVLSVVWLATQPAHAETELVITGASLLSEKKVRATAGPLPSTIHLDRWAKGAINRILRLYMIRGYTYARAWYRADPDGQLRIDIDEGRMAGVVFLDASAKESFIFRMSLNLPGDIYQKTMVENAMKWLLESNKERLVDLTYKVVDRSELVTNILGDVVPRARTPDQAGA